MVFPCKFDENQPTGSRDIVPTRNYQADADATWTEKKYVPLYL